MLSSVIEKLKELFTPYDYYENAHASVRAIVHRFYEFDGEPSSAFLTFSSELENALVEKRPELGGLKTYLFDANGNEVSEGEVSFIVFITAPQQVFAVYRTSRRFLTFALLDLRDNEVVGFEVRNDQVNCANTTSWSRQLGFATPFRI